MASSENVKDLRKRQMLKESKLAQLDKEFKCFTAVHSGGNPMNWPMIIEKAEFFYN
jgi:hypothetical protein